MIFNLIFFLIRPLKQTLSCLLHLSILQTLKVLLIQPLKVSRKTLPIRNQHLCINSLPILKLYISDSTADLETNEDIFTVNDEAMFSDKNLEIENYILSKSIIETFNDI